MNRKIISTNVDNITNFIIKAPRETARSTSGAREYISEIWYKDTDGKIYIPIIQPPRLRVRYKATQYTPSSSYSYCVSMYNYDIDPEIEEFYKFVQAFDKHIVSMYTDKKAAWDIKGIKNKYWTAMKRKGIDDYYFVVKLIHDKDNAVLTSINNTNRTVCTPSDIIYGIYIDQYISPTYITYNTDGMHPIWNAHQVVISELEKVFLGNCLLDHISGPGSAPPPPPPPGPPGMPFSRRSPARNAPKLTQAAPSASLAPSLRSLVNESDLHEAIRKLRRPTSDVKPVVGNLSLITPEDLQKRKHEIDQDAKSKLMYESIQNVPIEGGTIKRKIRLKRPVKRLVDS